MTIITKSMIDSALDATDFAKGPVSRRWMKNALAAAFRHAETCEPEVKPLEWSGETPYHVARVLGIGGPHYSIERIDADIPYFELKGTFVWPARKFPTIDEAKTAAQENFEARIRSALTGGGNG